MREKKILFLMDDLSQINPKKDTTYAMMLEAQRQGAESYFLSAYDITYKQQKFTFRVQRVIAIENNEEAFKLVGELVFLNEDEVDAIFIRLEPPFNQHYLNCTWLLDKLEGKIPLLNSPSGIRTVNEKIWASSLLERYLPETLITCDSKQYQEFLAEQKHLIVKPTDGFGGEGVFQVREDDSNKNVIFEQLSNRGQRFVICQRYIPEASRGDKRILLLDGEFLGAIVRQNLGDDHRNNLVRGGEASTTQLTKIELEIIEILKPKLKSLGLFFVGIDILGDYLIEVNVTCPTGIQEASQLANKNLCELVLNKLKEQLI